MRRLTLLAAILVVAGAVIVAREAWRRAHPGVVDLDGAWQRVQEEPRDPGGWAHLADAQAVMDQLEAAEQSYRTSLRLGGEHPDTLGRLGFLLYGQGRNREAFDLLRRARDRGSELPMLSATIAQLEEHLAPLEVAADVTEEGDHPAATDPVCAVPVRRTHALGAFLVDARVAGESVTLVVDTGASITALGHDLIDALGIDIDEERYVNAITATGPAQFPTATVSSVEVGGERVKGIRVAVCNGCGGRDAHGLLGLDVQAALGLDLDIRAAELRFVDCD